MFFSLYTLVFQEKLLTHRHTETQTHRQNDYRTLPPTLRGEGNYAKTFHNLLLYVYTTSIDMYLVMRYKTETICCLQVLSDYFIM